MFPIEIVNLGAGFKKYFEILPALTEQLKFEPERPDGRETDDYDAHSLHCLIRSVQNGEYVGCTRLVRARPGNPQYPLPFERTCAKTIDRSIVDPQSLPRDTIAEISRLAVIARYRARRMEKGKPFAISEDSFGTVQRPRYPYLTVGLYLGTIELAAMHGIETLFVLTEPRLSKHSARLGVDIRQIGGPVEHRGARVPSIMTVSSVIGGINFVIRPLYKVVAEEVRLGVRAQREMQPAEATGSAH